MTKAFKFRPSDVGTPNQKIIFDMEGEPTQEFPIPDLVVPDDGTQRFWLLYNKLVELGAIPDKKPIYESPSTTP